MTSSSDRTGGPGDRDWPFDRTGTGASGAGRGAAPVVEPRPGGPEAPGGDRPAPARRRPPLWALVVAGVLVVALVVVAVVTLSGRDTDPAAEPQPEVPEAEVVTLPPPTPMVEPIAKEARTAFYDALPSTVLAHALSESADDTSLLLAGALESYRLVYTDGADQVVLLAGQWPTPEGAAAAYQAEVQTRTGEVAAAGAGDAGDGAEEDAATSTDTQEGAVLVDGAEVGRYTLVPRGDGTGTLTWTNGTALLQLDGPVEELLDLHTAFPL